MIAHAEQQSRAMQNAPSATKNDTQMNEYCQRIGSLVMTLPSHVCNAVDAVVGQLHELSRDAGLRFDFVACEGARAALGQSRHLLTEHFTHTIRLIERGRLQPREHGRQAALSFQIGDLCLVTDAEVRRQKLLERTFDECTEYFAETMTATGWFTHLALKHHEVSLLINALAPGKVAFMLQQSIHHAIRQPESARIIYRFVAAHVFGQLNGLYGRVSLLMREAVRIALKIDSNDQRQQAEQTALNGAAQSASGVLDAVSRRKVTPIAGRRVNRQPLTARQLAEILEHSLQCDLPDLMSEPGSDDLHEIVGMHLASSKVGCIDLDSEAEDLITRVSQLFGTLLDFGTLIPAVRRHITRLQVAVLLAVMEDKSVLGNAAHPVRCCLPEITALALRIVDIEETCFAVLTALTEELIHSDSSMETRFVSCLTTLDRLMTKNGLRIDERSPSMAESSVSVEQEVESFLGDCWSQIAAHPPLHDVAHRIWFKVLTCVGHQQGVRSAAWREATDLYRAILETTSAKHSDAGKQDVLRRIPVIVKAVKGIFRDQGIAHEVESEFLRQLAVLHLGIIRGKPAEAAVPENEFALASRACDEKQSLPSSPTPEMDAAWAMAPKHSDQSSMRVIFDLVEGLTADCVLELQHDATPYRVHLIDRSRFGQFVLRTLDQQTTFKLSKVELVLGVLRGTIRRLGHRHVVAQATEQRAVSNLR